MGDNRLFWPQEMMNEWVVDEKASIEEDILNLVKDNKQYKLNQAVHFISDVGDGDDAHSMIGRVKETTTLEEMGAEHYMDSVIIEDSAYQVTEGFTGEPLNQETPSDSDSSKDSKPSEADNKDKDLLANFLLDNL